MTSRRISEVHGISEVLDNIFLRFSHAFDSLEVQQRLYLQWEFRNA
jgi:hypothetical protein